MAQDGIRYDLVFDCNKVKKNKFTMNSFILLALISAALTLVVCLPTPLEELRRRPALHYLEDRDDRNQYHLNFETAEGIKVEEKGELRRGANDTVYLYKSGRSIWKDADGVNYVTNWSSDDMGYHVDGDHLPGHSMPLEQPIQMRDDHRIPDMPNIIYNMPMH